MKKMDWLFGALIALVGLLLIVMPKFWICALVIILGLGSIAYGGYILAVTRKLFDSPKYKTSTLIKAVASILVGLIAVVSPMAFGKAVWGSMIYLLAVFLVAASILGFYSVSLLKNSDIERKQYVVENLILLAVGIILFLIGPDKLGKMIIRIIGIVIMIVGVVFAFMGVKSAKDVLVIKAEVKDEPAQE